MTWAPATRAQVPRFEQAPVLPSADLGSLDPKVRLAGIEQLQRLRDPSARQALTDTLRQDPDPAVRQAAAVALARTAARPSRGDLTYASVCDPDPATRAGLAAHARQASVKCHERDCPKATTSVPSGEAQLLTYLRHPYSAARLRALRLLAGRKARAAHGPLWDMATNDPCWAVRVDALRVVAPRYGKKTAALVKYSLSRDPDSRVRAAALQVLDYLRLPPTETVELAAVSARSEVSVAMRKAAIDVVAKAGGRHAAHQLALLATTHDDEDTRLAAVDALLSLGAHRAYAQKVLARILSADRSGKVRAAALKMLAGGRSVAACSAFAQRINDPEAEVRKTVVERLAACPSQVALPALAGAARDDKDGAVRKAALQALAGKPVTGPGVQAPLAAALQRDRDPANRRVAFEALLALPIKDRAQILVDTARSDDDPELRRTAVDGLVKLPSRQAVPALAHVVQRDAVTAVRLAAVKALGRYSDEAAYNALLAAASDTAAEVRRAAATSAAKSPAQRTWVNAMLARTLDPSASARLKAATSLCALQVPRTYRALVRLLWIDSDPSVRTAVARCFADLDSPLIDVALSVAHGTDADGGVVRTIELSQRQRVTRVSQLLEQAQAQNVDERLQAVKSLIPGANRKVRQLLEQLLSKDPDKAVRKAAANKIYRYADQRALRKLMHASQNEAVPSARAYALRLYEDLRRRWASAKAATTLTTLVEQLPQGSIESRVNAAVTLGTLRNRRAFQPLQRAATSTEPELRYAALIALATFGDVAILSKAARDEQDKTVRDKLIQINYLRGGPDERLIAALNSTNGGEALRAVEAAAIRKVPQAVPHLARLALSHLDSEVRRGAARALVTYESPLAYWTVRVASSHDASKRLRGTMWGLAVIADPGST